MIGRIRCKGGIHQALDTEPAVFGDVASAPWTFQKVFLCEGRVLVFAEFLPHHLCVFVRNRLKLPIACVHPDGNVVEALYRGVVILLRAEIIEWTRCWTLGTVDLDPVSPKHFLFKPNVARSC